MSTVLVKKIFIEFDELTAREIIEFVKDYTGRIITISLKNKRAIIKQAMKLLYYNDFILLSSDDFNLTSYYKSLVLFQYNYKKEKKI
jgi:hypothetical protein